MKGFVKNRNQKSSNSADNKPQNDEIVVENTTEKNLPEDIQQDILNMLEDTMEEARKKYPNAVTEINTFLAALGGAAEKVMTEGNKKQYDSPVELKEEKHHKDKKDKKEKKIHAAELILIDDEDDEDIIDFGSEEIEDDDALIEEDIIDFSEFDDDDED